MNNAEVKAALAPDAFPVSTVGLAGAASDDEDGMLARLRAVVGDAISLRRALGDSPFYYAIEPLDERLDDSINALRPGDLGE